MKPQHLLQFPAFGSRLAGGAAATFGAATLPGPRLGRERPQLLEAASIRLNEAI